MKATKLVFQAAYIFITLPFIIFAAGYLKIWIAIPVLGLVLVSSAAVIRDIPDIEMPQIDKKALKIIIGTVIIILFWVCLSGIGRFGWQRGDHSVRNGIYEALVNESWPVGTGYLDDGQSRIRMMIYYIGFWLPSAVFGKVFGVEAGYFFQMAWAGLGIILIYFLISIRQRKYSVWPMILFIFFSGLDIVILTVMEGERIPIFTTDFLEYKTSDFLFTSFTVDLFDVFNQVIPAWIATLLIILQKNCRSIVYIWATVLLCATFPFIGLLPIVLYMFYRIFMDNGKDRKGFLKDLFTFRNVLGGGAIGIFSGLYLLGNSSGQLIQTSLLTMSPALPGNPGPVKAVVNLFPYIGLQPAVSIFRNLADNVFVQYICFALCEFLIYGFLIYRYHKKNSLFYVIIVSLAIIPFIKIGTYVDFSMRASIPPLLILFLLILDFLENSEEKWKVICMYMVLGIASISAFHMIAKSVVCFTDDRQPAATVRELCLGGNFGGGADTVFFKYLSKPMKLKELGTLTVNYIEPDYNEYLIYGQWFSKEENQMVATELNIEFNCPASGDIVFEDGGMLDDNSVSYSVSLNGEEIGTLDYDNREVILPMEYLNEYAQIIHININRQVKLYEMDNFKIYPNK